MEAEAKKAWDKFMQTGRINDYVSYISLQNTAGMNGSMTVSQGEINTDANNNTGINPTGNQYR